MKKQSMFFGVLLVGFGIFFLLNELHMSIAAKVYTWPVLLILIGAALSTESALSQDHSNLLASYILITLGIHFYVSEQIPFWPTNISMVVFMVAISFLLSARKAKSGFFQGGTLLIIAILMMFSDRLKLFLPKVEDGVNYLTTFWPILLLLVGLYLLFFKRK
ncbi:LiaI-LiaF-like domain-containing protein [Priestia sp. YIM B13486]|uniref:LiaF transmembrane domain-containing protein n=1 Tax=Priestia sp. YIM B13486 TaxID=3366304 RepID=UPI00366C242E